MTEGLDRCRKNFLTAELRIQKAEVPDYNEIPDRSDGAERLLATETSTHEMEYGFGAHEYPTSGVFEVEPRGCPGFIFRRSILLGTTDMSRAEFRSYMEDLSNRYHGDTYHLISKNCNHFTDEVCLHLTGNPIPGWVNRLARIGAFCNCLLPESIQASSVRHLPDHQMFSEDGMDSGGSSEAGESEEENLDHHLLVAPNSDVAFFKDKPVRLAKDIL